MSASVPLVWIGGQLYALGSVQSGQDLAFDLGGSSKTLTLKGTGGTVLTDGDELDGLGKNGVGSSIIAQSYGINTSLLTTSFILTDTQAVFVMVQVLAAETVTGVAFVSIAQGVYTADATNQVGLYSYSAGTLTRIASSTNDGSLWKQPGGTFCKEPFSATVDITPGIYFIGFLWNNSAPGITPTIAAAAQSIDGVTASLDIPNSGKTYSVILAQASLPASIAMSSLNSTGTHPWVALY